MPLQSRKGGRAQADDGRENELRKENVHVLYQLYPSRYVRRKRPKRDEIGFTLRT